jgi:hypothetical protein
MALDDETRQKLEQLKQEFAAKAADAQRQQKAAFNAEQMANKKAKGGKVSASSRADGIAKRGKTKGRFV